MTVSAICAATDFSDPARHAADRAARLAHETGAALTLMHVLPGGALQELRQWLGAGHPMEQQLQDDAQRHLGMLFGTADAPARGRAGGQSERIRAR